MSLREIETEMNISSSRVFCEEELSTPTHVHGWAGYSAIARNDFSIRLTKLFKGLFSRRVSELIKWLRW